MNQRTHIDPDHLLDDRNENNEPRARRLAANAAQRKDDTALILPQNFDYLCKECKRDYCNETVKTKLGLGTRGRALVELARSYLNVETE